jgi:hypothetical protein
MSDFTVLAGLFLFVMAAVTLAGYAFWNRAPAANESVLDEPPLPGTQAFLARAFRRVGETVPAASAASNPMRRLLISAGYRYPSSVPIFHGISARWDCSSGRCWGCSARQWRKNLRRADCGHCGRASDFCCDFLLKPMIRSGPGVSAAPCRLLWTFDSERWGGPVAESGDCRYEPRTRAAHPDWRPNAQLWSCEPARPRRDTRQLGARNSDPELKKLCSLLIDSDRFGTSLAPALRTHVNICVPVCGGRRIRRKVSVKSFLSRCSSLIFACFL